MLKVYFAENNDQWSSETLAKNMQPLPADMQARIRSYQNGKDRQNRVSGRLMLLKLIRHFNLPYTLSDLRYTAFHRPYFEPLPLKSPFHFSIAHSADLVICAGTMDHSIGVDIESITDIDLEHFYEHLTAAEWKYIHQSPDQQIAFYHIWTRKEALIKAIGRGIDVNLDSLDVCGDQVVYQGETYTFHTLPVAFGYMAHLATSAPSDSLSISFEKHI